MMLPDNKTGTEPRATGRSGSELAFGAFVVAEIAQVPGDGFEDLEVHLRVGGEHESRLGLERFDSFAVLLRVGVILGVEFLGGDARVEEVDEIWFGFVGRAGVLEVETAEGSKVGFEAKSCGRGDARKYGFVGLGLEPREDEVLLLRGELVQDGIGARFGFHMGGVWLRWYVIR